MIVLGLESTCDESAAAVLRHPREVLSSVVKSQIDEHTRFGGVVPEIASRLHLNYLSSCVHEALERAELSLADIDVIAVSNRPGLQGGLLVGTTLAKTLSYLCDKPLVMVDHLLGHLVAPDLEEEMVYPCVAGIFSGAHSNVYLGKDPLSWEMLARSRDDAPGEAFDKTAKLLGLSYPGGPSIQKNAEGADEKAYQLPLPLPKSLEGDFSFSGLKTAVLYHIRGTNGKEACPEDKWPDLAASFQFTVAKGLTKSLVKEAKANKVKHIYIGGGVAANSRLREYLKSEAKKVGIGVSYPPIRLCVDNATMIARAGALLFQEGKVSSLSESVSSRSEMGLSPSA
ncbi:MAG: tRNA (adenosine(37)-N6)-threonylcarbamoyltransferase complex transferase subunit TsaD [Planctomycetes bacterium]|nr:tRNA (adenosine(37)-N6)-threonylcarbamoyltransferase complex transferase subunit TsaD [Planctomycetota bacterium]